MRIKGSILASEIDTEYRKRIEYQKKLKQQKEYKEYKEKMVNEKSNIQYNNE